MKRKIFILVLALILSINTVVFAYGDIIDLNKQSIGRTVTPRYDNIATITMKMYCDNDVAECYVDVTGNSNVTKIVVNMTLEKVNSEGDITRVATWNNITANSNMLEVIKTAKISSGFTYILTAKTTAYVGTSGETVTKSISEIY